MRSKPNTGFTLLEVLISLAILTISLSAIVSISSQRAETLIELRDKNDALIVANNILEKQYEQPIESGISSGKLNDWYWQVDVNNTNNKNIIRIEVSISKDSNFDYSEARLTGFKWK